MSGAAAWMPFYVGDYLGDTQRLTTEQHGAYLLLMLDYWRNGPPPDDDQILQQITKLDRAAWKRNRSTLERMFQIEGGEWHHKRIDRELVNAETNAERRSSKAKAAAEARWNNAASNAPSNAKGMPQALPVECPPPSPSSGKKNTPDKSGVSRTSRGSRLPDDFDPPAEWIEWAMKKRSWHREEALDECECFVRYWQARPGREACKLDWSKTWQNWVTNSRRVASTQKQDLAATWDFMP